MQQPYLFESRQMLPVPPAKVWDFLSTHRNLKHISPEHIRFEIVSEDVAEKMYAGMIIKYKLRPLLGIPVIWVTKITEVVEGEYFIDEQRSGPFKYWQHYHRLETIEGGTLMTDTVRYLPPLGFLGSIANALFISRMLNEIFAYRFKKLEEIFGVWKK